MAFDASPGPENSVCHLQGLARTSVAVDYLPFGQVWFRSVIKSSEDRRTHGPGYGKASAVQSCPAILHSSGDWKVLERILSEDMDKLSAYLQTLPLKLSHAKTVTAAFFISTSRG